MLIMLTSDIVYLTTLSVTHKSRMMRWAEHAARNGGVEMVIGFWWPNLRELRLLGKHRGRWKDNIALDIT
jgi:hypothetical protein